MNIDRNERCLEELIKKTEAGEIQWKPCTHPDVDPHDGCYFTQKGSVDLLLAGGHKTAHVWVVDTNGRYICSLTRELNANELWDAVEKQVVDECLSGIGV